MLLIVSHEAGFLLIRNRK